MASGLARHTFLHPYDEAVIGDDNHLEIQASLRLAAVLLDEGGISIRIAAALYALFIAKVDEDDSVRFSIGLGTALTKLGDVQGALKVQTNALALSMKLTGLKSGQTRCLLLNQGNLFRSLGENDKSRQYLKQVHQLNAEIDGEDSLSSLEASANYANSLYQDNFDLLGAESLFRKPASSSCLRQPFLRLALLVENAYCNGTNNAAIAPPSIPYLSGGCQCHSVADVHVFFLHSYVMSLNHVGCTLSMFNYLGATTRRCCGLRAA
jgi:tetratricopeptide (TPR) repeat protein